MSLFKGDLFVVLIFKFFLGFQSRSTSLVVFSTLYAIPVGMYGLSERGFEDHVARAFCKQ